MGFQRLEPGAGAGLLAGRAVARAAEEELLVGGFRRQLDLGLWAAVPIATPDGRRQARMVRDFSEIPRDADRVIFFPRAAGGA